MRVYIVQFMMVMVTLVATALYSFSSASAKPGQEAIAIIAPWMDVDSVISKAGGTPLAFQSGWIGQHAVFKDASPSAPGLWIVVDAGKLAIICKSS